MSAFLLLLSLSLLLPSAASPAAPALLPAIQQLRGGAGSRMVLGSYAAEVAGLFNNMKTPASILAGALVPLGFLAPLPSPRADGEPSHATLIRKLHLVIATASLSSELLSVMWATVAVNKLTETAVQPAVSTWALIQRDFELPWLAVNAHFVLGMLGFMAMVGSRAYLTAIGTPYGLEAAGCATASLLLMLSVVNRGVESGGGEGLRYGSNILALIVRYVSLLLHQAIFKFGFLEISAMVLGGGSLGMAIASGVKEYRVSLKQTAPTLKKL